MAWREKQLFPLGLYGLLLAALCWLALPRLSAPLERWILGATCLPLRAYALLEGREARAATTDQGARQLQEELLRRQEQADLAGAALVLPAGLRPLHCRVLEARGRGGAELPAELVLDRSWAEVQGCEGFVTKGDSLLGFLAERIEEGESASDPARVLLLHHQEARRVAASMRDGEEEQLHFVVEAAGPVDPAPLRTELWDDPYRASRLQQGLPVLTVSLQEAVSTGVPGGLRIGTGMPWGYQGGLVIDVFVRPVHDPQALTTVVLWTSSPSGPEGALRPSTRQDQWIAAELVELPRGARFYAQVASGDPVPDGSAVVVGERLLGTGRGLGLGQALVTPFAASTRSWALWLLPDDPAEPPRQVRARVAFAETDLVWLRGPELQTLPRGFVFTGSNGLHCPAGLLLGRLGPPAGSFVSLSLPTREPGLQAAFHVGDREVGR